MGQVDHYNVLGVAHDASPEEIKRAFRREALRWHPDRNPGDREAEQRFKAASAAYEVLRDREKRRAYDMELAGFGREPAFANAQGNMGRGRRCGRGRGRRCSKGFGPGRRTSASSVEPWWARADRGSAAGPLVTGEFALSFGCDESRESGSIGRDRLVIGVPWAQVQRPLDTVQ